MQKEAYKSRAIEYRTLDAVATEVRLLDFLPKQVMAGRVALRQEEDLKEGIYTLQLLPEGGHVVRVRYENSGDVSIRG